MKYKCIGILILSLTTMLLSVLPAWADPQVFNTETKPKTFNLERDVGTYKEWFIKFSHELDQTTVNIDTVRVINSRTKEIVPTTPVPYTMDGECKQVQIRRPDYGYDAGAKYIILVDGVKSADGRPLAQPAQKEFITMTPNHPIQVGYQTQKIDNTGVRNTFSYQDQVTMEIPANAIAAPAWVSIAEVTGAKRHSYSNLETLATYNINLGINFNQPLTLRFAYDPQNLDPQKSPQEQLVVGYLDEESLEWVEVDFQVDQLNNQLIVQTDHLSFWSVFGFDSDTVVSTAPNFKIYFNKNLEAPRLKGDSADTGSYSDPIYEFAAQVRTALVDAYDKYTAAGLKLPSMTKVYVDDFGVDAAAEWSWKTGNIKIPVTYHELVQLKHDCAHELFHAAQNQDINFLTMNSRRWWMEATADYAAAAVVGTGKFEPIDQTFLEKSMGTANEVLEYKSARFIDYLVRYQGVNFGQLWQHTAAAGNDMLGAIDAFLREKQIGSLGQSYRDFARHLIFSQSSPARLGSGTNPTPYAMAAPNQTELAADKRYAGELKPELQPYKCFLWGIEPEFDGTTLVRNLIVELRDDLLKDAFVDVFVIDDDQLAAGPPQPQASLQYAAKSATVPVTKGQKLFVLVTNGSNEFRSPSVAVKEFNFTVEPNRLDGKIGQNYIFSLWAQNLPPERRDINFVWDFGDGETKDQYNLSQGSYSTTAYNGFADYNINHKYQQGGTYTLEVELQDANQDTIAQATATINIQMEDLAVKISPPGTKTYKITQSDNTATHQFTANVTPAGNYQFNWNYGDGAPVQTTTGPNSTVSHTYTGEGNYKAQVQVCDVATGKMLGQDNATVILEKKQEIEPGDDAGCGLPASNYYQAPKEYYVGFGETAVYGTELCDGIPMRYGRYEQYADDGVLMQRGCYAGCGKKYGLWEYWSKYGVKYREETYALGGIMHGISRKFYDNGNREYEATYNMGKVHGQTTSWYENGNISSTYNYVQGMPEGDFVIYWESGLKRETGSYSQGKKHGLFQLWNYNGNLYTTGNYNMGEPVGQHKYYNTTSGQLHSIEDYDKKQTTYYNPDGSIDEVRKW